MLHLHPRANWFPSSKCTNERSWLPSSKCPFHICRWGCDSLLKVPFIFEAVILSSTAICPGGADSLIEVPLVVKVLILFSRCPWLWGPNSLLEFPLTLRPWSPPRGSSTLEVLIPSHNAINFKVILSSRSWFPHWGIFFSPELIPFLRRFYHWGPYSLLGQTLALLILILSSRCLAKMSLSS